MTDYTKAASQLEALKSEVKMIVNCLISRIDVYRVHKLHIQFNFYLSQFFDEIEELARSCCYFGKSRV